jgi:hypothetical protein
MCTAKAYRKKDRVLGIFSFLMRTFKKPWSTTQNSTWKQNSRKIQYLRGRYNMAQMIHTEVRV